MQVVPANITRVHFLSTVDTHSSQVVFSSAPLMAVFRIKHKDSHPLSINMWPQLPLKEAILAGLMEANVLIVHV